MYRFTSKQYADKLLRYRLQTKEVNYKRTSVSSSLVVYFFCSCLLGARARTFASKNKEVTTRELDTGYGDDSGSKLRDKEQQRLSSK